MPLSTPRHLRKALTYITCREHLLVFIHVTQPEAGIQVPGGTVEDGELPQQTAIREAKEETGLTHLRVVTSLGSVTYDMSPFGKNEIHERHFFHLATDEWKADRWQQWETSGGKGRPKLFELYWAKLDDVPSLIAGHGDLLSRLSTSGRGA